MRQKKETYFEKDNSSMSQYQIHKDLKSNFYFLKYKTETYFKGNIRETCL